VTKHFWGTKIKIKGLATNGTKPKKVTEKQYTLFHCPVILKAKPET
jgi:hypothetical protein